MASGGRRRGRVLIFVALIIILLVVLAWAVMRFLNPLTQLASPQQLPQQQNSQAPTDVPVVEMAKIVISTQPIQRGQEITGDVLAEIPFPTAELVEGAYIMTLDEVVGKRAKVDIEARLPLNANMLVDPSMKNSPPAFQIPRGQVAISIPVSNLSSVAYGLQSGDHVNVIATLMMVDLDVETQSKLPNKTGVAIAPGTSGELGEIQQLTLGLSNTEGTIGRTELDATLGQPVYVIPSEDQRPRLVSQTLIQDAVVLQSGEFPQPSEIEPVVTEQSAELEATPVPAEGEETQEPVEKPSSITLIVNPQDAVTLNYLIIAGGKLNLVMRSAGDDQRIATEAVTLQFVLDQYGIPNPAKLPYGLEPRTDSFPGVLYPFPYSTTEIPVPAAPVEEAQPEE